MWLDRNGIEGCKKEAEAVMHDLLPKNPLDHACIGEQHEGSHQQTRCIAARFLEGISYGPRPRRNDSTTHMESGRSAEAHGGQLGDAVGQQPSEAGHE